MRSFILSTALAATAVAFPASFNDEALAKAEQISKRQDALGISKAQTNCGPTPCLTFDPKEQLASTTGDHAYASPGPGDIRGPCPGLNAASNHGYLPRDGIASIEETVSGLGALYGMSPELAVALAAYAIAIDGNVVEGVWSIGGPLPTDDLTGAILGTGQGLSYSHNNYEGDASIGRGDAYTNNGDAHSLLVDKFEKVYAVGGAEDRYTLDKFRARFEEVQDEAIASNPYFFTGAFSTFVVVPAAYNFVINFMSNHSAEEPSGYLDGYNFKSFFGISGEPGSFVWNRGQERVPDNWYRRPSNNQYRGDNVFEDVGIGYAAYPRTLKFGGNTGTTNSFVGLDIANLTGGTYNAASLTQKDKLGCFAFNVLQQGIPAAFKKPLSELAPITDFINKNVATNLVGDLNCPGLAEFDQGLFNQYPGRSYSPSGQGQPTNY